MENLPNDFYKVVARIAVYVTDDSSFTAFRHDRQNTTEE